MKRSCCLPHAAFLARKASWASDGSLLDSAMCNTCVANRKIHAVYCSISSCCLGSRRAYCGQDLSLSVGPCRMMSPLLTLLHHHFRAKARQTVREQKARNATDLDRHVQQAYKVRVIYRVASFHGHMEFPQPRCSMLHH
jgi:hypothetical protein